MDEETRARVDASLREWLQGDCVLGEQWFLFRLDVERPLTAEAAQAAKDGVDAGEVRVHGLMVATQTCDIRRRCADRPFVEVCPLVEVDPRRMEETRRGRRPRYAFVPGVEDLGLVADLDRVMTVEKAVVAGWHRREGCRDDDEIRDLSYALARKRARFAFPDDFVEMTKALQRRMTSKHAKQSEEGRALRALREIRVRAAPSWNEAEVELLFLFVRDEGAPPRPGGRWDRFLKSWLALVPPTGRFREVYGEVTTLEDLSALDYVESDPLDLDHLSLPRG